VRTSTAALLAALVAIAAYAISIWPAELIYDDVAVIRDDERLRTPAGWRKLLTQSYNNNVDNLYRPLVSFSYVAQYQLHGPTAWPYRLVNVLLHGIASGMVVVLATRLSSPSPGKSAEGRGEGLMPLVAGVLFAIHPVHVEAVVGVVGRAELLCTIGFVGALIQVAGKITARRAIGAWLFGIVALLSKEQGMLLLPAALFVFWFTRASRPAHVPGLNDGEHRPSLGRELLVAGMLTLAAYIVFRESTLKFWWDRSQLDAALQPMILSHSADIALMPLVLAGRYLHLLLFPHALSIDYAGDVIGSTVRLSDPYLWLGGAAVIVWIAVAFIAWRRRDALLGVSVIGFGLTYGVVANIVSLTGVNLAERLMYLPSVFVVLIAAKLIASAPRRIGTATLILLCGIAALRTVSYAARWSDRESFYRYSADVQPLGPQARALVADERKAKGDAAGALDWARRATDVAPGYERYWYDRARKAIDAGDFDDAQRSIDRGRSIRDNGLGPLLMGDLLQAQRASTRPAQ
jgi:hypothetical protein